MDTFSLTFFPPFFLFVWLGAFIQTLNESAGHTNNKYKGVNKYPLGQQPPPPPPLMRQ
jgi:hypothetical protein